MTSVSNVLHLYDLEIRNGFFNQNIENGELLFEVEDRSMYLTFKNSPITGLNEVGLNFIT